MRKVLIANRGEIAVRVARACKDVGLSSVAVYADTDREAPHVKIADEAFALGGSTPSESYLDSGKILEAARSSGADAIHPGYGFLSENADFADLVTQAGLTWIGPPPHAIRDLGDKVAARRIAQRVGAPLVAGTPGPVSGPGEVTEFASEHGLPIAMKAAHGGGGRGLRVARTMEEIPEQYDSAVREAVAAFDRGECFVERYLDQPRHVETQCLADKYGNVMVVSTRDCSLQRRHQKLVEEAPAPWLDDEQHEVLVSASKAILREAGYVGAGTCEFLVQEGTISFLEVNTRLQVEHPVSEEVTGIDLVQEMFRIADGGELDESDPLPRAHSFEFRINGEDPGRGFLPMPGTVASFALPGGPGVRVDSGVEPGTVIGPAWDSLLAKVIVTGATREQAVRRARRALEECAVEGLPTVLPFHRAVLRDPDFVPELDETGTASFNVHTKWIENDFHNTIQPATPVSEEKEEESSARRTVVAEVGGKRIEVSLPASFGPASGEATKSTKPGKRRSAKENSVAISGASLVAPMQGKIVRAAVEDGQRVDEGDLVVVVEAMKMEQPLNAHRSGTVRKLDAELGASVSAGAVVCQIDE